MLLLLCGSAALLCATISSDGGPASSPSGTTETAGFTSQVGPLNITQFTADPLIVRVNVTSHLNVTVTGGSPPVSFAYTGLPINCTSRSTPALICVPWQVGTFTIKVWVNDSMGPNVTATTRLLVRPPSGPALVIADYSVKPATVPIGGVFWIRVNTTGGTLPVSYGFYGLPPGCFNFDEQNLSCVPRAEGEYPIVIAVTDSDNRVVDAVAFLNVTGNGSGSSGTGLPSISPGTGYAVLTGGLVVAATGLAVWRSRRSRGRSDSAAHLRSWNP